MARPRLQLDEALIERLAAIHCPLVEIAAALNCSVDTLERNYAALIDKGRQKGKQTLRRIQWDAAQKGNVVMMIWLGKQLLGQSDKLESKVETSTAADNELAKLREEVKTALSERK
jgi:hypothetical protein